MHLVLGFKDRTTVLELAKNLITTDDKEGLFIPFGQLFCLDDAFPLCYVAHTMAAASWICLQTGHFFLS